MERKTRKILSLTLIISGLILMAISACSGKSERGQIDITTESIVPQIFFQARKGEDAYLFRGPRDMTIDKNGALYIFDYDGYAIKKYDRRGNHVLSFGGEGREPGRFTHLTNIRAVGDRLCAVDSTGLDRFSLSGEFISRRPFKEEILTDHPAILDDGSFVGVQILAGELRKVLSFRTEDGEEVVRLASHDLRQLYPGIEPGEDFFLSEGHAPTYCYAIGANGDILWADSREFKIHRYHDGSSTVVISEDLTPEAFPGEERLALEEQRAKLSPPLFLYVPDNYQLVYHLLAGPRGEIWIYVKSRERTGFLRYSAGGQLIGHYLVEAPFNPILPDILVRIFDGTLYFFVKERGTPLAIYAADLPHRP